MCIVLYCIVAKMSVISTKLASSPLGVLAARCLVTLPRIVKVHEPRVQEKILYPPFDIEIPKQTYTDFVWSGVAGHAHLPALVCGISGR